MLQRSPLVCFSCTERESSTGGWVRERTLMSPGLFSVGRIWCMCCFTKNFNKWYSERKMRRMPGKKDQMQKRHNKSEENCVFAIKFFDLLWVLCVKSDANPIFSNSNTLVMASWYCCVTEVAVLKDRELLMNQDFKHEETEVQKADRKVMVRLEIISWSSTSVEQSREGKVFP